MPLYEYECEACGTRFEKIQKFSDPPLDVCAKCGKGPVKKLLSSPAIQFKGSGWYITDYAKTKETKETKGTKETTKGETKGESKGESKGDSKSESSTDSSKTESSKSASTKSE